MILQMRFKFSTLTKVKESFSEPKTVVLAALPTCKYPFFELLKIILVQPDSRRIPPYLLSDVFFRYYKLLVLIVSRTHGEGGDISHFREHKVISYQVGQLIVAGTY